MKKGILYLLIATFSISALLGIGIIILDLWNELTLKVMLTTLTIFGFSVPALCCATLRDKTDEKVFPIIGIVTSIIGGLYTLLLLWEIIDYDFWGETDVYKWLIEFIILSASFGHISLMLLINSNDNTVLMTRNGTIIVSIALDFLLTFLIFIPDFEDLVVWQFYAILAILIVLGTIVTPILKKARNNLVVEPKKVEEPKNNTNNAKAKLDDLFANNYVTDEEYKKILNRINNK
jgi:hypothetical protein